MSHSSHAECCSVCARVPAASLSWVVDTANEHYETTAENKTDVVVDPRLRECVADIRPIFISDYLLSCRRFLRPASLNACRPRMSRRTCIGSQGAVVSECGARARRARYARAAASLPEWLELARRGGLCHGCVCRACPWHAAKRHVHAHGHGHGHGHAAPFSWANDQGPRGACVLERSVLAIASSTSALQFGTPIDWP